MVSAYILIQAQVGRSRDVASAIREVPGVVRADPVTGIYDVIVLAEAASVDDLGLMIISKIQAVPGISRTVTCSVLHL